MTLLGRRRGPRFAVVLVLLFVFIIAAGLLVFIEVSLKPTIIALAETQARWAVTEIIHKAVLEGVVGDVAYKDIIHIEKDSFNRIVLMQHDVIEINRMASNAALNIQGNMEKLKDGKFKIPLGQILGSTFLAHSGPSLSLKLLPVGTVKISPRDILEEAGINQVRHYIYLDIDSDVKVVIPFINSIVDVKVQVPVADAVIVGNVPETYMNLHMDGIFSGKSE